MGSITKSTSLVGRDGQYENMDKENNGVRDNEGEKDEKSDGGGGDIMKESNDDLKQTVSDVGDKEDNGVRNSEGDEKDEKNDDGGDDTTKESNKNDDLTQTVSDVGDREDNGVRNSEGDEKDEKNDDGGDDTMKESNDDLRQSFSDMADTTNDNIGMYHPGYFNEYFSMAYLVLYNSLSPDPTVTPAKPRVSTTLSRGMFIIVNQQYITGYILLIHHHLLFAFLNRFTYGSVTHVHDQIQTNRIGSHSYFPSFSSDGLVGTGVAFEMYIRETADHIG
jgi:hypothetical protein